MENDQEFIRKLQKINLVIILDEQKLNELKDEVCRIAKEKGIEVHPRAEGFAFMKDERVILYGLPHLRFGVLGNRAMVWVRAPYKFSCNLLRSIGIDPREYFNEILSLAKAVKEIMEKYKEQAQGTFLQLPD